MTINITVKCQQGIVMGSDSLVTLSKAGANQPAGYSSRYRKIFSVGRCCAGVMLNGQVAVGGRTVEDLVREVTEKIEASQFSLSETGPFLVEVATIAKQIKAAVDKAAKVAPEPPSLQLFVAGFSPSATRYGEVYTLTWRASKSGVMEAPLTNDGEFGYLPAGQVLAVDRFMEGFDANLVRSYVGGAGSRFREVTAYAGRELAALLRSPDGAVAPELRAILQGPAGAQLVDHVAGLLEALEPPLAAEVVPWRAISSTKFDASAPGGDDFARYVIDGSRFKARPYYAQLSLPMAVDLTWHLLLMAHAEHAFFPGLPRVGSRLTVATLSRRGGFAIVYDEEPGVKLAGIS